MIQGRQRAAARMRSMERGDAYDRNREAVRLHGDMSPGNLSHNGRLSAVIDFGMVGVGGPAYAIETDSC